MYFKKGNLFNLFDVFTMANKLYIGIISKLCEGFKQTPDL